MTAKVEKSKGRSFQDFRAAHDKSFIIPQKIKEGLKELGSSWAYESEFIRQIGVSNTDIARFRDDFEEFIVETKGKNNKRVWAGTKDFAAKLRESVI